MLEWLLLAIGPLIADHRGMSWHGRVLGNSGRSDIEKELMPEQSSRAARRISQREMEVGTLEIATTVSYVLQCAYVMCRV